MTERLYYQDSRLFEFDAVAIEHVGDAHHVVLDRTAFYPTSGGQPHDTGRLGPARVTDVVAEADRIIHVVDVGIPLGPVHGVVDESRRRDHMQQHTAQHLLSAIAADRLAWEMVSVHFGPDHSAIEFSATSAADGQLADLEQWANAIVAEARPVTVSFEDAGAAARVGLRKPSGRTGEIRVITIADLDRSACGGTHVSRTSEIGPVLLVGVERLRGHVRLSFLAGTRVLVHARATDATLARLARDMNCAIDELEVLVPARQQEVKALRDGASKLEQEVAASRLRALVDASEPGPDGVRRIQRRVTDESAAMLRAMAQAVGPLDRVLFVAISPAPPTIYFAASIGSGVDAGAALKQALAAAGGRGGGSARAAQGTAATVTDLEAVAASVLQP